MTFTPKTGEEMLADHARWHVAFPGERDEMWSEWSKNRDFDEHEDQARAGWDAAWSAVLQRMYIDGTIDHRTGGGPFYRDSQNIPPEIKASIDAHVMRGKSTGSFLQAVLENDLKTAVVKADESNYLLLGAIVGYCCNEIPVACWGSEDVVAAWQKKGGWLAVYPGEPLRMKGLVMK